VICSGVDKVAHYDFLSHKYNRTHVVNDDILPKIRNELLTVLYFIVKLKNMFNSQLKKMITYIGIREVKKRSVSTFTFSFSSNFGHSHIKSTYILLATIFHFILNSMIALYKQIITVGFLFTFLKICFLTYHHF
jgi:hypothetical protein